MKTLKILFLLLVVTTITSTMGIKAQDYHDSNEYFLSMSVPPILGTTYSYLSVVKQENGKTHKMKYTEVSPSYDDLDVQIHVLENGKYQKVTNWKLFRTGWDIEFNSSTDSKTYENAQGKTFKAYMQSRLHYTKYTGAYGRWYVN